MIIESALVLVHSLSEGYHSLATNMTYYDFNLLRQIIKKINKKEYNGHKILGLPDIDTLPVDKVEKKFLANEYSAIIEDLWRSLNRCIVFYDKYRIIYGKSKHGLIFQTGVR